VPVGDKAERWSGNQETRDRKTQKAHSPERVIAVSPTDRFFDCWQKP